MTRTLIKRPRLSVTYSRRSRRAFMGRFGGGWNWKVGVQAGSHTAILSLLVAEIRVDWAR